MRRNQNALKKQHADKINYEKQPNHKHNSKQNNVQHKKQKLNFTKPNEYKRLTQ